MQAGDFGNKFIKSISLLERLRNNQEIGRTSAPFSRFGSGPDSVPDVLLNTDGQLDPRAGGDNQSVQSKGEEKISIRYELHSVATKNSESCTTK